MARQVVTTVRCDGCGKTGDMTTVTVAWDDERWELDLCERDMNRLWGELEKWVSKGRKVERQPQHSRRRARSS